MYSVCIPICLSILLQALYLLCNLACHGEDICTHLVESKMLQVVVPVLKTHDVEVLNLALALCEMAIRMTPNVRAQKFN